MRLSDSFKKEVSCWTLIDTATKGKKTFQKSWPYFKIISQIWSQLHKVTSLKIGLKKSMAAKQWISFTLCIYVANTLENLLVQNYFLDDKVYLYIRPFWFEQKTRPLRTGARFYYMSIWKNLKLLLLRWALRPSWPSWFSWHIWLNTKTKRYELCAAAEQLLYIFASNSVYMLLLWLPPLRLYIYKHWMLWGLLWVFFFFLGGGEY